MNALEVLKKHFVGKKIVGGQEIRSLNHAGKTVLDIQVDNYEPILAFLVEGSNGKEFINVLFDWDVEVDNLNN